jgi:CheY-like chemotaxis protein
MFSERFFLNFLRFKHQNEIILTIDSNRQDIDHTVRAVTAGGYNVLKAYNGKEGLTLTYRHKPDLIIVDLNLADMTGGEFCRRLKSDPQIEDIPIIILTATDTPQALLNCYEQGIENYLVKPVGKNFLLKEIERVLGKNHQMV